ncbi:hypothetical protein [Paenibacillus sp. FJAT-26967]|uniref:hypothetical protein n=1 Tax=Paenibacillus sp. FJAT-26967 TaxID=1729690 RepID=UPI00083943EF|nr:hypothetical protein [Paenibacillus sp. FJAT-26967]
MKKLIYSPIIIFLAVILCSTFTIKVHAYSSSLLDNNEIKEEEIISIQKISERYKTSVIDLLQELNKGYTLTEIITSLQYIQQSGETLGERLHEVNPNILKSLKDMDYSPVESNGYLNESNSTKIQSLVENFTHQDSGFVEMLNEKTSIIDSNLPVPLLNEKFAANSTSSSDPIQVTLNRIRTKADRATYSAASNFEGASMISGALQLQVPDMTLKEQDSLSFTLERQYDSAESMYSEKDIYSGYSYKVRYYPGLSVKLYYKYNNMPVDNYFGSGSNFFFSPYRSFLQFGGKYTYWNFPTTYPIVEEFNNKTSEAFSRIWKYQNPLSNDSIPFITNNSIQLNGTELIAKAFTTGEVKADPSLVPEYGNTLMHDNTLKKDANENRFPIGKGWRWNIPYIETIDEKKFIRLQDGVTYEVVGSTLKGDIDNKFTFENDSTVNVGNIMSSYALKSTDGKKQYFSKDGQLIQISNSSLNSIQFEYQNVAPYGQVISKIKGSSGDEIVIGYSGAKVTITKGTQVVTYDKIKDPQGNKELLAQVTDVSGNRTQYVYNIKEVPFDLVGAQDMKTNFVALITQVYQHDGIRKHYEYEDFTRVLGPNAKEKVYRLKSKQNVTRYTNGNEAITDRTVYKYSTDGLSYKVGKMSFITTAHKELTKTAYSFEKFNENDNIPERIVSKGMTESPGSVLKEYVYDTNGRLDFVRILLTGVIQDYIYDSNGNLIKIQ